jgi:hypothetical protein
VGSLTTTTSSEEIRQALRNRALHPTATPPGAGEVLLQPLPVETGELDLPTVTPVIVYRVPQNNGALGSGGTPERWWLRRADFDIAQRAAAICLPADAAVAPDPARLAVGSMYRPLVEALWQEIAEGFAVEETIMGLLSVAQPPSVFPRAGLGRPVA